MAGCEMQICLTSLWSPNHSSWEFNSVFCHQKATLCSPVPEMNLWIVFSGSKVIGCTPLFWLTPVGCPWFSSCCYPVPAMAAAGMGAFWRSLTPAELNPTDKSIFFSYYAPLEGVIPLASKESFRYSYRGNLCFDGRSSWWFESKLLFHCSTCSCDWGVIRCALIQIMKDLNNLYIIPIEQKLHI